MPADNKGDRMPIPENAPKPGFYYHFKHDDKYGINHYAYEVIGIALDAENPKHTYLVVYRSLYEDSKLFMRTIENWNEIRDIEWVGTAVPRFTRIEDPQLIAELSKIRDMISPIA